MHRKETPESAMGFPKDVARFTALRAKVKWCGCEKIPESAAGKSCGLDEASRSLLRDRGDGPTWLMDSLRNISHTTITLGWSAGDDGQ